jgi:hypothetical protein
MAAGRSLGVHVRVFPSVRNGKSRARRFGALSHSDKGQKQEWKLETVLTFMNRASYI